jgi:hypothetical protein
MLTGSMARKKISPTNSLKGVITGRSGDTLKIRFWDILHNSITAPDPYYQSATIINSQDNGREFLYIISSTEWIDDVKFKIPFRFRTITATNIPFRVGLKGSKKIKADFLNANVSYFWIWGQTKFYKKKYIKERDSYFGLGPFVGLSSIDDPSSDDDQFGASYGVNFIYSVYDLNLVLALGADNGFKRETNHFQPYLGFGIGFKIVEITSPKDQK